MRKVLITVPNLELEGGVANYYKTIKLNENSNIEYFNVNGGKFNNVNLRLIERYIKFLFLIRKFDVVHINPSLLKKSFLRDSMFILLAKLFNKKVVVFIRGWNNDFENKIHTNKFYQFILNNIWNKVDKFLILGEIFKKKLKKLGISKDIQIETTLSKYQSDKVKEIDKLKKINLLFISRLIKEKGIFIALDTMKIVQQEYNLRNIYLKIAGGGIIFNEVENYIKKNKIENTIMLGRVSGKEKDKLFEESHILLFPTYYGEGLPNSILEGMGSGMPILSRTNAGIPDQIIDGINGYLTESKDPRWFAKKIIELLEGDKYEKISLNNIKKAKYYSVEEISKRLFKIYEEL